MAAILMTGATGFVGAHFVPHMQALGHDVSGLCRPTSQRAHLGDQVTWCMGDVTDAEAVHAAAGVLRRRADARGEPAWLVHGAGVISYATRAGSLMQRVDVDGTRHVLDASRAAGIDRVLLVSSVVAVGVAPAVDEPLDETADFSMVRAVTGQPHVSEYMRTKRAAEELALAATDLDVVVVNPGSIYGRAPVPSNSAQIFKRVESSLLGRIVGPGSLSVVGVQDVARGMQLALERGARGQRYLLTDENLALVDLLERIQRVVGVEHNLIECGPRTWRALVAATRLLDRVRPLHVVTPTALQLLGLSFSFDSTRARRDLGWQPEPFDTVLRRTAAWLLSIGWLNGPLPDLPCNVPASGSSPSSPSLPR